MRTTALQQLQQLADGDRRKRLFLALTPLWTAVNGANTADSPYRRMMALNGAVVARRTAARPSATPPQLSASRRSRLSNGWFRCSRRGERTVEGPALEPWDYWYASSGASRELSPPFPASRCCPRPSASTGTSAPTLINSRYVTTSIYGPERRRWRTPIRLESDGASATHGVPLLARVSANYEQGGLFVLNELIHEDGHAVHFAALRTRPAYFSLGDDLFFEAFADVPAWSSSEPAWQRKYLGSGTTEGAALRELFSNVMLDVAWGLFELRMLADPSRGSEPAVGRDHLALSEHHRASGIVMVGIAGPVGALAGLHDQLRTWAPC